jgi:hypothetical protein
MIHQILTADVFTGAEYVPHAVIRRSPAALAAQLGATFEPGSDDFDVFEIAAFRLDDGPAFALMRYRGHPEAETRLLLAHTPDNVARTHQDLAHILDALGLPPDAIGWTREPSAQP